MALVQSISLDFVTGILFFATQSLSFVGHSPRRISRALRWALAS